MPILNTDDLQESPMSELIVLNGYRTVQLANSHKTALIDASDHAIVDGLKWSKSSAGHKAYACYYKRVKGGPKTHFLHRLILNAPPGVFVDHKNGDGLDCRRENIRLATQQQNARNIRRTWGAVKYKGVTYNKHAREFQVAIMGDNNKRLRLGGFGTEQDAARAYDREAIRLHGEFACTNAEMFGDL